MSQTQICQLFQLRTDNWMKIMIRPQLNLNGK